MNPAIATLSRQGYVPETCLMEEPLAFPLIMAEVGAGRSPCWGCSHDRGKCQGEPKRTEPREETKH